MKTQLTKPIPASYKNQVKILTLFEQYLADRALLRFGYNENDIYNFLSEYK